MFSYYSKIGVAAIKLAGALTVGDRIHFKGSTTDFSQVVEEMQIEHKIVGKAKKGQEVGIKVNDRVRPNDVVYREE